MGAADSGGGIASLADFLDHGALGVLAMACLVVLGYNTWNLNNVIRTMPEGRIMAASPLLRQWMLICSGGFALVCAGAIYLGLKKEEVARAIEEAKAERNLILAITPREYDVSPEHWPIIKVGDQTIDLANMHGLKCTPQTRIDVNFERYVKYRASEAAANSRALEPPPGLGTVDPEV